MMKTTTLVLAAAVALGAAPAMAGHGGGGGGFHGGGDPHGGGFGFHGGGHALLLRSRRGVGFGLGGPYWGGPYYAPAYYPPAPAYLLRATGLCGPGLHARLCISSEALCAAAWSLSRTRHLIGTSGAVARREPAGARLPNSPG